MYQFVAPSLGWFACCLVAASLTGCTPTDNWRDLSWADGQVAARFPCKPTVFEHAHGTLVQCVHRGVSYALAWQRMSRPEAARNSMRDAVARFEQRTGAAAARMPGRLPLGALEWPESGHYALYSASEAIHLQVWVRGLTVYQATALGPADANAVAEGVAELFIAGVRSTP
jgi:hypothetical protein